MSLVSDFGMENCVVFKEGIYALSSGHAGTLAEETGDKLAAIRIEGWVGRVGRRFVDGYNDADLYHVYLDAMTIRSAPAAWFMYSARYVELDPGVSIITHGRNISLCSCRESDSDLLSAWDFSRTMIAWESFFQELRGYVGLPQYAERLEDVSWSVRRIDVTAPLNNEAEEPGLGRIRSVFGDQIPEVVQQGTQRFCGVIVGEERTESVANMNPHYQCGERLIVTARYTTICNEFIEHELVIPAKWRLTRP